MYRWLWERIPGGKFAKTATMLGLGLAITAALFLWGFPALDNFFGQSPIVQG